MVEIGDRQIKLLFFGIVVTSIYEGVCVVRARLQEDRELGFGFFKLTQLVEAIAAIEVRVCYGRIERKNAIVVVQGLLISVLIVVSHCAIEPSIGVAGIQINRRAIVGDGQIDFASVGMNLT